MDGRQDAMDLLRRVLYSEFPGDDGCCRKLEIIERLHNSSVISVGDPPQLFGPDSAAEFDVCLERVDRWLSTAAGLCGCLSNSEVGIRRDVASIEHI